MKGKNVFLFFKAVLELKQAVESVQTADGITLNDVCSKPLFPRSSYCNIQVNIFLKCIKLEF